MLARALLIACLTAAAGGCTRPTTLPSPAIRPIDDLPPGQYYDQGLPAPHDVHVRPYTTLVPVPGPGALQPAR